MGLIDGVVATKPGWIGKVEVVEVVFDPEIVGFEDLVKLADEHECAAHVFTRSDAQQETAAKVVGKRAVRNDDKVRIDDDKFYMSRTVFKHVPLTRMQATHVNAWVGDHEDPMPLLTPCQRRLLAAIQADPDGGWPVAIRVPFSTAWKAATEHAATRKTAEAAD